MPVQPTAHSAPRAPGGPPARITKTTAPTIHDPGPSPVPLDSLSYGELAVAIHAAGIPAKPSSLTAEQIKALAFAGIARLGLAQIRRLNAEWRAANISYCNKTRTDPSADTPDETATIRRLWGSSRREQTAVNLGYRLQNALMRGQPTA